MGFLTVTGVTMDTGQFRRGSDADTFKLDVTNAEFTYRPWVSAPGIKTDVFRTSRVDPEFGGRQLQPCIKDNGGRKEMILRLEGVDAPELHYAPLLRNPVKAERKFSAEQRASFTDYNEKGMQPLAEEARQALQAELEGKFGTAVDVVLKTRVGQPGDVFDIYGRFVGGLTAGTGAGPTCNVAVCVARNGWAFPSFYEGMENDEIKKIADAAEVARTSNLKIWALYDGSTAPYPTCPAYCQPKANTEGLTLPKLYRRQAVWWSGVQAGLWRYSFYEYLVLCAEKVLLRQEHAKWGRAAAPHHMAEFVTKDGTLTCRPENLIFLDGESRLLDANDQEVLSWIAPDQQKALWKEKGYRRSEKDSTPWVNTVAISDNGERVVSGTFRYDYAGRGRMKGWFGASCRQSNGALLWADEFEGWSGAFAVAVSGDGKVAAAGGWFQLEQGLLRVYNVDLPQGKPLDKVLDLDTIPARVNSVSLSQDGSTLAAAADRLYVFRNRGAGYQALDDPGLMLDGVSAVAVHPDGTWMVACNKRGEVLLVEVDIVTGAIKACHPWKIFYKPTDRRTIQADLQPVPLICAAVARDTNEFAVGGGDFVYVFSRQKMVEMCEWRAKKNRSAIPPPDFPREIDVWCTDSPVGKMNGGPAENVRGVAFSADGLRMAVVANENIGREKRGRLRLYEGIGVQRSPRWDVSLPRYPNFVSLDGTGANIAVAFGFPEKASGGFSIFDKDGKEKWWYQTSYMNWPVAVSTNGQAMAGGCDDGLTYYFEL